MKQENSQKKTKKITELFVQELARTEGGQDLKGPVTKAGPFTTLALGEESGR